MTGEPCLKQLQDRDACALVGVAQGTGHSRHIGSLQAADNGKCGRREELKL